MDADLLRGVLLMPSLNASEELSFDLVGELKTEGIVVGELLANVARISPG